MDDESRRCVSPAVFFRRRLCRKAELSLLHRKSAGLLL